MLGHQRDWNEEGQKEGWTEKIKREETCQRKERVGISEVESTVDRTEPTMDRNN